MEFQTMGSYRPLSKFMLGVVFLILMASIVILCQKPSALLWTVVPSQLMQWLVFLNMNCKNTILEVSSSNCFSMFTEPSFHCPLIVSSTYTSEQSLQGISYTTPACFCSGVLVFTCI